MKKNVLLFLMSLIVMVGLNSCEKDPPVCDFTFTTDGLTATFTAVASNTDSYLWDFGDETTSTEANPTHTYQGGGEFEVKLTVTGEGGTDSKKNKVTVVMSMNDIKLMLTGGPSATNGKTWVLSPTPNATTDGASAVTNEMPVVITIPGDFMGWLGDEIDNEFTFKHDGTYTMNPRNDKVLATTLFSTLNGFLVPDTQSPYGTCDANFTPPASATWTLNETDIVVDAITNPSDIAAPPTHGNVTITGKKWLSFSPGAYFAILDWPTSNKVIIKSISPTEMHVAIMLCMYQGVMDPSGLGMPFANYPTHIFHFTFVPKP